MLQVTQSYLEKDSNHRGVSFGLVDLFPYFKPKKDAFS